MPTIPHGPPLGTVGDWRCECGYISEGQTGTNMDFADEGRLASKSVVQGLFPEPPFKHGSVCSIMCKADGAIDRPSLSPSSSAPSYAVSSGQSSPSPSYSRQIFFPSIDSLIGHDTHRSTGDSLSMPNVPRRIPISAIDAASTSCTCPGSASRSTAPMDDDWWALQ